MPDGLRDTPTQPQPIEPAKTSPRLHTQASRLPRTRPAALAGAATPPLQHRVAIRFTGSGSEYFRIWIVNLLLTLLTLGIYYPWAKVRRLKYFHGNTLVDDEPLSFHGNPRKMLRGFALVGLMLVLYTVAGQMSPIAGLFALVIVTVLWPALLRASLQFRLGNTAWRGLRMRFTGSVPEVYVLLWPSLGFVLFTAIMTLVFNPQEQPGSASAWPLLMLLPLYAALVWMFWRLKKYQHDNYGWASLATRFTPGPRSFYALALRGVGVLLLSSLGAGVVGLVLGLVAGITGAQESAWSQVARSVAPLAIVAVFFAVLKPWFTTRLQNLVWSGTTGEGLQFRSALRFRPMVLLTLVNWLLIVVTLGLYWPFAAVAMARMRLEAVSVALAEHPAALVGRAMSRADDASGDAAGDLFGIDLGL